MKKVCIITSDNDLFDYRIVNQALSLVGHGYNVRLVMAFNATHRDEPDKFPFELLRARSSDFYPVPILVRCMLSGSWESSFELLYQYGLNTPAKPDVRKPEGDPSLNSDVPSARPRATTLSGRIKRALKTNKILLNWCAFNRMFYLPGEVEIARKVMDFTPDIIHVHDLILLKLGLHLGDRLNAKVVYDSHEIFPLQGGLSCSQSRYWTKREREDIGRAAAVITVNSFVAKHIADKYNRPDIKVIHNTDFYVDNTEFRQASRLKLVDQPLNADTCILMYMGGLTRGRGLVQLVKALALLPSNYLLCVLGDGPFREEMEEAGRKSGVSERLIMHGHVPREQVSKLLVGADLGLVAQQAVGINEINCSPNRLCDYLMAGIPVLASDLPFLRHFLNRYKCGDLFDPESPESIAECILRTWNDRSKYQDLHNSSLEAAKEFNWNIESKKLLALYAEL